MADSFVQVPADGAGKRINAYTDVNGDYNQTAVLVDQTGTPIDSATTTPGGSTNGLVIRPVGTQTVAGSVTSVNQPAGTATITNPAAAITTALLLGVNANRLGLIIYNDSSATLRIKYGATASASSFTYLIGPGIQWEMPAYPVYTGRIDGIWTAAGGNGRITELTA